MDIRSESQRNPVADEVSAQIAVVRPVLVGLVQRLKEQVVQQISGGRDDMQLLMLARNRRPSDGDLGVCFEYAVHDAIRRGDSMVLERVDAAARLCKLQGEDLSSILFAIEKTGAQSFIDTAHDLITPDSRILSGSRGYPASLKKHLDGIAQAFRRTKSAPPLPLSISGIWKADLFLGATDSDRWLATSVKSNAANLEHAPGLRIGVVPLRQGESDKPRKDEKRNLVVCPLLYDGQFVETFYTAWNTVQLFLAADAQVPREDVLPNPAARQVARTLAERRTSPVSAVIEALDVLAQPELLETVETKADLVTKREEPVNVQLVLVPQPSTLNDT
jgi:hypothetical protein